MRLDGIGDALACAPLVAALRAAGHELGGLFSTRNAGAFALRAFDRVHTVERIPWPRHGATPQTRQGALAEICASSYDIALIASEELDAYAIAREAGIGARVGFTNGWEKPLKTLRVRTQLTRALVRPASAARVRQHEVETLFRLGAGLHSERTPTRDPARLRPLVLETEPSPNDRVVLQLTRKFARAGLDAAALGALARRLASDHATLVCLTDDPEFGREVAAAGARDYEKPPTLDAWKTQLAGARAVVTPDSGAAHIAGMLGVPTVALFPTTPAAPYDIVRWRPWLGPSQTLVATEFASIPSNSEARERFAERVARELEALLVSQTVA